MDKTELMKRYEAETGESARDELYSGSTKLYMPAIDYIAWLEAQLTWRPVSEKPEKAGLYWCELLDNETGSVHYNPCQYVGGWLGRYQVIRYVPIPPAPDTLLDGREDKQ